MATKQDRICAYFAAPLFNEMERGYNNHVTRQLEEYVDVFLPQRDGGLLMQYVKEGISPDIAASLIFQKDLSAIQNADLLIAVLDGNAIDEGVAFEIGYMFATGGTCVALQTDVRRALPTGNNRMISSAMTAVFQTVSELIEWVKCASENSSLQDILIATTPSNTRRRASLSRKRSRRARQNTE